MTQRSRPRHNAGMGALALNVNRNKRSLAVDLKTDDGRAVLDDLLATADVLVTNMRPGAPDRLGLDPDTVSAPSRAWCTSTPTASAATPSLPTGRPTTMSCRPRPGWST
jgi:hypothetical protein